MNAGGSVHWCVSCLTSHIVGLGSFICIYIDRKRVDGDLAVSRGLGDFSFKARDDLPASEQRVRPGTFGTLAQIDMCVCAV